MKSLKFPFILSTLVLAVMAGVFLISFAMVSGETPDTDPPGEGVSPTFTGITVDGVTDLKGKITNTDSISFVMSTLQKSLPPISIDGDLKIEGTGNLDVNGKIINGLLDIGGATPVTIGEDLEIHGNAKAKSFGKIYYKDSGWINYVQGDDKVSSLSCHSGDQIIGCWVNDKNSQNLGLDVRNQFFPSSTMCQVDFNALSNIQMNQSVVCWDPQSDYSGPLYSYSDGSGGAINLPFALPIVNTGIFSYLPSKGFILNDLSFMTQDTPTNVTARYVPYGSDLESLFLSWDGPEGVDESDIMGYYVELTDEGGNVLQCPSEEGSLCFMADEDACPNGETCFGEYEMQFNVNMTGLDSLGENYNFAVTAIYGTNGSETGKSGTSSYDYVSYQCLPQVAPEITYDYLIASNIRILYWDLNTSPDICYPNHVKSVEIAYYNALGGKLGTQTENFSGSSLNLVYDGANSWDELYQQEGWSALNAALAAASGSVMDIDYASASSAKMRVHYDDGSLSPWSGSYALQ